MPYVKKDNQATDFYSLLPHDTSLDDYQVDYPNHLIKFPCRGLIVGASGSGKTTTMLEILKRTPNTWDRVVLVIPTADEPLYRALIENADPDTIEVYEQCKVPRLDRYSDHRPTLVIFDDCISLPEKQQQPIIDYFIRARKQNVSCFYLSQTFYGVPKTIRLNLSHLFLKRLSSIRDLNRIFYDCSLGVEKHILQRIYDASTVGRDFLTIDLLAPEHKFRHNLLEIWDT